MGLWDSIKSKASEAKEERLQWRAAKKDIRKKALAASLVAERGEDMKVARQRGIERARRPTGFAGFTAGLQNISGNLSKLSSSVSTSPRPSIGTSSGFSRRKVTRYVRTKGNKYKKVTSYKSVRPRVIKAAPSMPTMADLITGSSNKPKSNNGMMNFRF